MPRLSLACVCSTVSFVAVRVRLRDAAFESERDSDLNKGHDGIGIAKWYEKATFLLHIPSAALSEPFLTLFVIPPRHELSTELSTVGLVFCWQATQLEFYHVINTFSFSLISCTFKFWSGRFYYLSHSFHLLVRRGGEGGWRFSENIKSYKTTSLKMHTPMGVKINRFLLCRRKKGKKASKREKETRKFCIQQRFDDVSCVLQYFISLFVLFTVKTKASSLSSTKPYETPPKAGENSPHGTESTSISDSQAARIIPCTKPKVSCWCDREVFRQPFSHRCRRLRQPCIIDA